MSLRAIIDHIAKARGLVLEDPSYTRRLDSLLTKAALDLEALLHDKPGAASWSRDGYGKDPT